MGFDATPTGSTSQVSTPYYTPDETSNESRPKETGKPASSEKKKPICQPQTAGENVYEPGSKRPAGTPTPKNNGVLTYPMAVEKDSARMTCFEPSAGGKVTSCEVSAIWCFAKGDEEQFCLAVNDKANGKAIKMENGKTTEVDLNQTAGKVESASISPDGKILMFTTSFDRDNPDFNKVLVGDPTKMDSDIVLKEATCTGKSAGLSLRNMFMNYLKENVRTRNPKEGKEDLIAGHFKFEGTAILPDGKVIFAIRQMGEKFFDGEEDKMEIKVLFLVANYEVKDGVFGFTEVSSHLDLTKEVHKMLGNTMAGVSSVEYSPSDGKIYFLTTTEESLEGGKKKLTTQMWSMPLENLGKEATAGSGPLFSPVLGKDGKQVQFDHKGEGMAIEEGKDECENPVLKFTITCDDDREDSSERGGLNNAVIVRVSVSPESPALVRAEDSE